MTNSSRPSYSMTWPYGDARLVTLSDTEDLEKGECRGIMVATDGAVSIITRDNTTITLPGLKAGVMYPVIARRIRQASTTATGIIALY